MNRERIIELANAAADADKVPAWQNEFWTLSQEELERFAKFVTAEAREECAKLVEAQTADVLGADAEYIAGRSMGIVVCAAAIRNGGK